MSEDRENIPGLPPTSMIAVLADAAILALVAGYLLTTDHIDQIPRLGLVIAFVIVALTALLILLGRKMPPRVFHPLRLAAMMGNGGLLVVLGFVALLAIALLGSGGARGGKAIFEVALYIAAMAAALGLNMKTLADAEPPRS